MNNTTIFTTNVPVLINMINYGGHLGYDSVLAILQEARLRWLRSIIPESSEINIQNNVGWLVKEIHVTYEAEAHHGDMLSVSISAPDKSKASITLNYTVNNISSGKLICSALTTLVFFDFNKSKIAKAPEILITNLRQ